MQKRIDTCTPWSAVPSLQDGAKQKRSITNGIHYTEVQQL